MELRPCLSPDLCGVNSHKPGTPCLAQTASKQAESIAAPSIKFGAPRKAPQTCSQPDCQGKVFIAGLCSKHKSLLNNKANEGGSTDEQAAELTEFLQYESDIAGSPVDRDELYANFQDAAGVSLRSEQLDMTHNIVNELQSNDRAQIRAACGMGKTFVQEAVISEYDMRLQENKGRSGTYMVVVPSIKLAQQMAENYEGHGVLGIDGSTSFSVHHDPDDPSSKPVDSKELADFLAQDTDGPRVIFAVGSEASVNKVAEAQKESGVELDMVIFDEAHKYTVGTGSTVKGMLFNSDNGNTVNSKTRVFMTATPVSTRIGRSPSLGPESAEKVVRQYQAHADQEVGSAKRRAKSITIDQGDEYAFGKMVSSYSMQEAVSKGYLVKPRPYVSYMPISNSSGKAVKRSDIVTMSGGLAVSGSNDATTTLGAYQSVYATFDQLATDSAYESGSRSNTLAFLDGVQETRDFERSWQPIGYEMSASLNGGRLMSTDEAWSNVENADKNVRRAARIRLLADSASVISTSSKDTVKQRDAARLHFDLGSDEPAATAPVNGVPKDCKCGQKGRWCPCARVVSNFDMFSEGIDVSSIDTVVMDRPKRSSENMVVQAIGRSSRNFTDFKGNKKQHGNVVIPASYREDDSAVINAGEVGHATGMIDKMWSDRGNEDFRRPVDQPEELKVSTDTGSDGLSLRDYQLTYITDGIGDPLRSEESDATISERVAAARIVSKSFSAVLRDFEKDSGLQLKTDEEKFAAVMERVHANVVSDSSKRVNHAAIIRASGITSESQWIRCKEVSTMSLGVGSLDSNKRQAFEGHPELRTVPRESDRMYTDAMKSTKRAVEHVSRCM